MSSNIIPIVSASPPPFDESLSFEEGWAKADNDDDFGGFTAAAPAVGPSSAQSASIENGAPVNTNGEEEFGNFDAYSFAPEADGDWAEFGAFPEAKGEGGSADSGAAPSSHCEVVATNQPSSSAESHVEASVGPTAEDSGTHIGSVPHSDHVSVESDHCEADMFPSKDGADAGSPVLQTQKNISQDSGLSSDISPHIKAPENADSSNVSSGSPNCDSQSSAEEDMISDIDTNFACNLNLDPGCHSEEDTVDVVVGSLRVPDCECKDSDDGGDMPECDRHCLSSDEKSANSEDEQDCNGAKKSEDENAFDPAPLDFKPSSFTGDETNHLENYGDETFGQFHDFAELPDDDETNAGKDSDTSAGSTKAEQTESEHIPNNREDNQSSNEDKDYSGHKEVSDVDGDHLEDDFGGFARGDEQSQDGDFGAFSETQVEPASDSTSWCAFGDQSTVESSHPADDWAVFSSAAAPTDTHDDFGDFEDVTNQDEEDDFGTFEGPSEASVLPTLSVEMVANNCFPYKEINGNDIHVTLLEDIVMKEATRTEEQHVKIQGRFPTVKNVMVDVNVWNNLKDLDNTAALKYQWNKSNNSVKLLRAISIDTRNILMGHKKHAVPVFAAGLGLLEPSKGSSSEQTIAMNPDLASMKSTAVLVNNVNNHVSPQDIPPAEFDWSSSGLTNPLDSANLQLDLDFFALKQECKNNVISPTSALETEFLKEIEPTKVDQPRQLQPLENLLANMNFVPTSSVSMNKQNENLSAEAAAILQQFPDLSFMRAKVLMFPVKQSDQSD